MTVVGRWWRWQERWLEYRALAENLRHGHFLAFVSEFGRAPGFAGGSQGSEPAWMLWYYRATAPIKILSQRTFESSKLSPLFGIERRQGALKRVVVVLSQEQGHETISRACLRRNARRHLYPDSRARTPRRTPGG
jgi:hypothetical protein